MKVWILLAALAADALALIAAACFIARICGIHCDLQKQFQHGMGNLRIEMPQHLSQRDRAWNDILSWQQDQACQVTCLNSTGLTKRIYSFPKHLQATSYLLTSFGLGL